MLGLEQIESVGNGKLEQQGSQNHSYKDIKRPEKTGEFLLSRTVYKKIEREKRKKILKQVEDIEEKYKVLSDSQTAGKMVDELLEIVKLAYQEQIMFGMPYGLVHGILSNEEKERAAKEISLIGHLIKNIDLIKRQNLSLENSEKEKLDSLCSKITDLISTGTYVSKEILDLCCNNIPIDSALEEKRNSYLLSLEKAVYDSIENDKKEGIVVERDNKFYCVKCPEESVITPAKFMNSPEFKDLEYGALLMGEGDNIIRTRNGQYRDMKGKVKMIFKVGDDEKIEMTLSSIKDNTLTFGAITVQMDDKSCEIFSKYLKELEKEPCISKVVEAAKSFAQTKSSKVSLPSSVLENVSQPQHSQSSGQELPAH